MSNLAQHNTVNTTTRVMKFLSGYISCQTSEEKILLGLKFFFENAQGDHIGSVESIDWTLERILGREKCKDLFAVKKLPHSYLKFEMGNLHIFGPIGGI